jgi:glycosyltransferase involved in cell wall biosynthesis
VSTDNEFIRKKFLQFNHEVFVVPGPCRWELYSDTVVKEKRKLSKSIVIGWVGSSSTVSYLNEFLEQLNLVLDHFGANVKLLLLGVLPNHPILKEIRSTNIELVLSYNEKQMIEHVSRMDIGLFPLRDEPGSIGRGTLKARIYMAGGAVVFASRLSSVEELIVDDVNGFLVTKVESWSQKMIELIQDNPRLLRIQHKSRESVIEDFSMKRCFDFLEQGFLNKSFDE